MHHNVLDGIQVTLTCEIQPLAVITAYTHQVTGNVTLVCCCHRSSLWHSTTKGVISLVSLLLLLLNHKAHTKGRYPQTYLKEQFKMMFYSFQGTRHHSCGILPGSA